MATFVFYEEFGNELLRGTHQFAAHTFKVALTNSAPNVDTHDELADVTQISTTGGYTTGGNTAASPAVTETSAGSGVWRFVTDDVAFTASGAAYDTFRYAVLYNDTSTGDKLIGYLDYGSGVTLASGSTFTVDVGTDGWFQLTIPAP
jgi:hypothetical protein